MQISGLTSYTAQQLSTSQRTHHTTIAMPNTNDLQDSVSISELGKRISMNRTHKAGRLTGGSSQVQSVAELMSKSLARVESTLEKMHELTKKASNTDLTELDRINMQIEYEELRETLAGASAKMNEGLAQISGQKVDKPYTNLTNTSPDGSKLLERARDRLMRGEDWDVAEAYAHQYDEETGEEISGYWVTGKKMTSFVDGFELSTVRDKIEGTDTVNLMSSITAKKGIERVEEQLTRVKDMREKFSSFIMSYNGEDLDNGVKVKDLDEAQRKGKFDSVLGIVEFKGAALDLPEYAHSEPKLVTPTNGMGFMFSRIDEMFGDIAGKLAATPIFEEVENARFVDYAQGYTVVTGPVMTGVHTARIATIEELEAIIRDGKSLDGYEITQEEQKDNPPEYIGHISSKSVKVISQR